MTQRKLKQSHSKFKHSIMDQSRATRVQKLKTQELKQLLSKLLQKSKELISHND
jgi:hypothetical protein